MWIGSRSEICEQRRLLVVEHWLQRPLPAVRVTVEIGSVVRRAEGGHEWRSHAPLEHGRPVDALEPRVLLDVLCAGVQTAEALRAVRGQKFLDQIASVRVHVTRVVNLAAQNLLIDA